MNDNDDAIKTHQFLRTYKTNWTTTDRSNYKQFYNDLEKSVPKYNNDVWNTPEETNPNFVPQLKKWKVDTLQHINTIYRLTENARIQAKAATEIYEQLQYVAERGWQVIKEAVEKVRRLAIFGYTVSQKPQKDEAREEITKAIQLLRRLKHLRGDAKGERKFAFTIEFVQQYYEASFQQEITSRKSQEVPTYLTQNKQTPTNNSPEQRWLISTTSSGNRIALDSTSNEIIYSTQHSIAIVQLLQVFYEFFTQGENLLQKIQESQQKFTKLGLLKETHQQEVCTVKVLELFLKRTTEIQRPLPDDHSLFLTYLQDDKKGETASAQPLTVANWVKKHMKAADIDEAYKPHSIRSTASTKAVKVDNSINKVKDHANWCQDSSAFERYYYKPSTQQHNSATIQTSIFFNGKQYHFGLRSKGNKDYVLGTTHNA
ncbi:MAG: hypothetical protein EXX96DRAFT_630758 [Benjaminiella poitrasii]|nr:MAG: hypothetical protein EXX96DRAFT_630758 [Benjaminiella poitrasii]